ncbi:hypothetical protein E4U54_004823, partial [Claviceps lovelessii]
MAVPQIYESPNAAMLSSRWTSLHESRHTIHHSQPQQSRRWHLMYPIRWRLNELGCLRLSRGAHLPL